MIWCSRRRRKSSSYGASLIGLCVSVTWKNRISVLKLVKQVSSENLNSPPVCSGVRVIRSCFLWSVDRCLFFMFFFSFGHCVLCPCSIYGFWFPLWYLQTVLTLPTLPAKNIFLHTFPINIKGGKIQGQKISSWPIEK